MVIPQEVNQAILGQGGSNDVEDPDPISILPPSNSNPNAPPMEPPSAAGSQTGGTPVVSDTSTAHYGYLTSFISLSDYNIFVEDKPDKVSEGHWHKEVLIAALSSVEPRKVPFSAMKEKRIPLFKRASIVTKTSEATMPSSTGV
ncbi:hypothetical protein LIER_19920 [Lithospermum erythrorhizon]|uniref:Uncharacterized protein n=1 Tax=Lithospermum erythrorhizon TaxID=34254 RepID=A0AAV3QQ50_LITER